LFVGHGRGIRLVALAGALLLALGLLFPARQAEPDAVGEPVGAATPESALSRDPDFSEAASARPGASDGPEATPARLAATTASGSSAPDPAGALAGAWRRHGCVANPGNPSCLTVTLAAECLRNATMPGCAVDRDGDRCTDVAEVLAGLDPFAGEDCIGARDGAPAINCLFLSGNLACDERPSTGRGQAPLSDCALDTAMRVRGELHPQDPDPCAPLASPAPDCAPAARGAECDAVAPSD
jgi:hypothetical protein